MKIAIVIGTMPDIIKMCPLVHEAESRGHEVTLIHSGQHDHEKYHEIADSINLRKPDISLINDFNIYKSIGRFSSVFKYKIFDIVLVHGDTNTAMSSAIAAHYMSIPVGHVEAGLRTMSREPYPEQTNTRIVDACTNLFFTPTTLCNYNLLNEGFDKNNILMCGNTIVDIALKTAEKFSDIKTNKVYFSAHREENMRFPKRVSNIISFANFLCEEGYDVQWVMRQKTKKVIEKRLHLGFSINENINIIDSLTYDKSIELIKESKFVCTDSGGLQEEASALHTPCLTMRYVTDRPETEDAGCNIVTTLDLNFMIHRYRLMQDNYHRMSRVECPYGDGTASKKIIDFIEKRKDNLIVWED